MNITAVITTYQRPLLAKRAILSVLSQTLKPVEIIVIEDASETTLEEWIEDKYPTIRYIRNKENLGLAGSRNVGIKLAKNDWIAFLDDDDEWKPERLMEQVKCFENLEQLKKNNLACIQVGTEHLDKNDLIKDLNLPENEGLLAESIQKKGSHTPSSSFLFNINILKKIDGFDEDLISGIDHDIWMKLAVGGYSNITVKKPLVRIYESNNDTMMTNTSNRIAGIKQYVAKWTPTYCAWFGDKEGQIYGEKYYVNVIGRLAAAKYAGGYYKEGFQAMMSIYKFINKKIYLVLYSSFYVLKAYLGLKFPILRKIRNLLIN